MITQPVSWFDAQDGAQLSARLSADCAAVARLLATSANIALRNGLQCVGAAVYLFVLHRGMAAAAGGVALVLAAAAALYGSVSRSTQRNYQDALAVAAGRAEESFRAIRTVRTFANEGAVCARYGGALNELARISTQQGFAYGGFVIVNHWCYHAMRAAALAVGGLAALKGHIDARQLTTFMLYAELFAASMLYATEQYGPIMESLGASERILSYLDRKPAPQLLPGVVPSGSNNDEQRRSSSVHGELEFKGVTFTYPTRPKAPALDRISLIIPAGRTVAFVGPSGSGKSTLIALVQRLYDPDLGAVRLDGLDLRTLDAAWYRSQLGVVSQDPALFSMTVAENISLGAENVSREDIVRAAEQANARAFIEALPRGFDTAVTDKLLSGGQRQRIAIARALVRDPKILVLDEATSALDAESEAAVHAALDRAMRASGRTVLVVAHRLATVMNADLTIVMVGGRIAERGTHAELVRRGGIYASLVARQGLTRMTGDRDLAPHETREEIATSVVSSSSASSLRAHDEADSMENDGASNVNGLVDEDRDATKEVAIAGMRSEDVRRASIDESQ